MMLSPFSNSTPPWLNVDLWRLIALCEDIEKRQKLIEAMMIIKNGWYAVFCDTPEFNQALQRIGEFASRHNL